MQKKIFIIICLVWLGYLIHKKHLKNEAAALKPAADRVEVLLDKPLPELVKGELLAEKGPLSELPPNKYYLLYINNFDTIEGPIYNSVLKDYYNKYKKRYKFSVLYVSKDKSEKMMLNAANKMSWPALKWNSKLRSELIAKLQCRKTPFLALISQDGKLIASSRFKGKYFGPDVVLDKLRTASLSETETQVAMDEVAKIMIARRQNQKIVDDMLAISQHRNRHKKMISEAAKTVKKVKEKSAENYRRTSNYEANRRMALMIYKLQGIAGAGATKQAVINGGIYSVGKEITEGVVLKKVNDKSVVIFYEGDYIEIPIYKPESEKDK